MSGMTGTTGSLGAFDAEAALSGLEHDFNTMFLLWAGTMVFFMQVRRRTCTSLATLRA